MALIIKRKSDPSATICTDLPKPKTVIKFGGSAAPSETAAPAGKTPAATMTERQKKILDDLGLTEPTVTSYSQLHIGARVRITSKMFPWVKHYKFGDEGYVKHISNNADPMGLDTSGGHNMHVIVIDKPAETSRKGQTAALFRWEFEEAIATNGGGA